MSGKVSVIIPVYNAGQWVEKCVTSVLMNSYRNIEVICIDDSSKDDSLIILNRLVQSDSRLIVKTKENNGVSSARNEGLSLATGDYILFVDADDWIDVETCEKAVQAMEQYSADVVLWSYVSETETRSSPKIVFPELQVYEQEDVRKKLHRRFIGIEGTELAHPELADSLCPVWGKLYKRSLIDKSGAMFIDLKEIGTYEDGFFNLEVFGHANRVVCLTENFYHYRRATGQSITAGYNNRLFTQWQSLYDRMAKYITDNDEPEAYKQALNTRIALGTLGLGLNCLSSHEGMAAQIDEIKRILNHPRYVAAYATLDFSYFPMHWKLFYKLAKYRMALPFMCLLLVIRRIVNR